MALHFGLANLRRGQGPDDLGLAVSAWTVNSRILMRRLIAFGVDSIMTDFPNRLIDASPLAAAAADVCGPWRESSQSEEAANDA